MNPEQRNQVLNLIQKLEFNGQVSLANILRGVLMLAERAAGLEQQLADARGGPGGGTTE